MMHTKVAPSKLGSDEILTDGSAYRSGVTGLMTSPTSIGLIVYLLFIFTVGRWLTAAMLVATGALTLLGIGYQYRILDRSKHIGFMLGGITLDLALVGYLQVQKHAVQKAIEFSLGPWQQGHIIFSTLALALYFPTLALGILLWMKPNLRNRLKGYHRKVAVTALVLRVIGFLLMFSMVTTTKTMP